MVTENWVNIGSGNGLLPTSTNPLPEPMLTYHEFDANLCHPPKNNLIGISQNINSINEFEIFIISKLLPPLPGVNKLKVILVMHETMMDSKSETQIWSLHHKGAYTPA